MKIKCFRKPEQGDQRVINYIEDIECTVITKLEEDRSRHGHVTGHKRTEAAS